MSERLDAFFDGDLPRDDLSAAEHAQVSAFDAQVGELRAALGEGRPSDMDVRVMRRISELGLEPLPARHDGIARRALRALWGVHELSVRWRPAYPLAAAALLAAVLLVPRTGVVSPAQTDSPIAIGATRGDAPIYVQFRLHTPDARAVSIAGSFSDWQPVHALQQVAEGVWTALLPIQPGVHDYAFVIDGEQWVPDPYAPQVNDGFGGMNSRLTLLEPAGL